MAAAVAPTTARPSTHGHHGFFGGIASTVRVGVVAELEDGPPPPELLGTVGGVDGGNGWESGPSGTVTTSSGGIGCVEMGGVVPHVAVWMRLYTGGGSRPSPGNVG